MTERLLQYIWQFQFYNKSELLTTDFQTLEIIDVGRYNTNQGPDFLNAKIKIAHTIWAGSIELHINTSDWRLHKHSADKNYNNVILHVVWNDDMDLDLSFPALELKNRVSKLLLNKYEELIQSTQFIPCEKLVHLVPPITIISWKERLLIERLEQKTFNIKSLLKLNKNHWEEVYWWILARNFGMKMNEDAFQQIAQSIPFSIMVKHRNQLFQLEALLLGQAGLLHTEFQDQYPLKLEKEFRFLKKKYQLKNMHDPVFFLRMRPANFPGIRLAQLAMLLHKNQQMFSEIKELTNLNQVRKLLKVTASEYWDHHYVFDESSDFSKKKLGSQMINNIIINTIVPVLFAYGHLNKNEQYKTRSLSWMEQLKAESNYICKGFESIGFENKSAFDSQSLLQLKKQYCDQKRCLQCAIGNKILK